MENSEGFFKKHELAIALAIFLFVLAGLGSYGYYRYAEETEGLHNNLAGARMNLGDAHSEIHTLKTNLLALENQRDELSESLQGERKRNDAFQDQLQTAQEAVDIFQKLSSIDEEILKKYSKVYFLSEHYTPSSLSLVDRKYLYYEDDPEQIHSRVRPYLVDLLDDARGAGVDLFVRSGYRSFGTQSSLKSKYIVTYGYGTANDFSADQGYSEHQLGTTVDFLTTGIDGTLEGFGETQAFSWLQNNAYKYGFILSYPKDNQYYIYEPWHWRFVGVRLATDLFEKGMSFYDMDQRKIDEYLISVFD